MDRPRGGRHYPRSVGEFQAWFRTDADCLDYLEWLRWPAGFACPACGPQVSYEVPETAGTVVADAALEAAIAALRDGRVVAVKGIGGYHLMCDATDPEAIGRLRRLKPRPGACRG